MVTFKQLKVYIKVMLLSDPGLTEKLYALLDRYEILITQIPASVKQHHNWTGGYLDHVYQVLHFAVKIYDMVKVHVDFSLNDVVLVAVIHDLDKLFRYRKLDEPKDGREWDHVKDYKSYDESAKVVAMCADFGIQLTDEHLEALALHHGGWSDKMRAGYAKMTRLASIIHSADIMSTFITNKKGVDYVDGGDLSESADQV